MWGAVRAVWGARRAVQGMGCSGGCVGCNGGSVECSGGCVGCSGGSVGYRVQWGLCRVWGAVWLRKGCPVLAPTHPPHTKMTRNLQESHTSLCPAHQEEPHLSPPWVGGLHPRPFLGGGSELSRFVSALGLAPSCPLSNSPGAAALSSLRSPSSHSSRGSAFSLFGPPSAAREE